MRRMIRSFRTRKNVSEQSALRDQFLRDLTREAEALMKQLSEQFGQQLATQTAQLTQQSGTPEALQTGEPGSISSIGSLLATGARYLSSRPRTSRSAVESTRSAETLASFRTSRAQAAAELQANLSMGEKNR